MTSQPENARQSNRAPAKQEVLPISLFAETPQTEQKQLSKNYAPFGRLIPCELIVTVDSLSIQTPSIGLVTEDIYHNGRLIIPATPLDLPYIQSSAVDSMRLKLRRHLRVWIEFYP